MGITFLLKACRQINNPLETNALHSSFHLIEILLRDRCAPGSLLASGRQRKKPHGVTQQLSAM